MKANTLLEKLNRDEVRLVLQTLSGRTRGYHFRAFTIAKRAFSLTKRAFSLTNFKHDTMLTPGVMLLIEVL